MVLLSAWAATLADDPAALAARILDDQLPTEERQKLIQDHPELASELVAAMIADLPAGDAAEEYRRIPWIWRVAVAAGKRNQERELQELLEVSVPQAGQKLRDWQAVVIGGGVINGISLAGHWPRQRIGELLAGERELAARWKAALEASSAMADDEQVKTGTRYDALRMIALDPSPEHLGQLARYLAKGTNAELQMGAVSGLADVDLPQAVDLLVEHMDQLTAGNRGLAIDALLRSDARVDQLLSAIERKKLPKEWLSAGQAQALRTHSSDQLRKRAVHLFPEK
jgi:hypothetical protein